MAQYDVNLRDYFRILRRRKWIVILVPLLFGFASFAMALLQAPKPLYRTTASVRVERAVSMTGLLQELVTFNPVGNLDTQVALIKSFPVMALAAKKLGLIPQEAAFEELWTSPAYLQAALDLREQIEVKRDEGTSLIDISVISADPEQAARTANAVAEAFQEDNLASRNRQVREARRYIESQIDEVGGKLRSYEEALKSIQEAKASLGQLTTLEGEHEKIRRAMDEVEGLLRLPVDGKGSTQALTFFGDVADPMVARLYSALVDHMLEREKLLLTFLPTHPQIQQVEAQIAASQQGLRTALQSRLQALRGKAEELQKGLARLRQDRALSPDVALETSRLEREVRFNERIYGLLVEKYQEALIKEKEQVPEVSLVRPAMPSAEAINPPQVMPKAGVGLVIGLTLGLVLAFVVEALDTSIGAIDEVESLLETSVLGVIPHLDLRAELAEEEGESLVQDATTEEKYAFLISLFLPQSRVVEAFRALRTNLLVAGLEHGFKTLMVTSSTQREGKTTAAINLAIALAQLGKRTLLVEADLRKPFLHHAFGVQKEPGLTEVVIGTASADEAILGFSDLLLGKAGIEGMIDRPGIDNLFLLPSGHQPANPTEFLSSQAVTNFIDEARQRYDYVVFDSAPVLPVADPSILGSRVDGTLLVVRVGQIPRAALRRAKTVLESANARILGVCLTGVRAAVSPDYAEMGYYQYRYGARRRRAAAGLGWWGAPAAYARGHGTTLLLLLCLLLAVAGGIWGWRAGQLRVFLLTAVATLRGPPSQPTLTAPQAQDEARAAAPIEPTSQPPTPTRDPEGTKSAEDDLEAGASVSTIEPPPPTAPVAHNGAEYSLQVQTFRSNERAQRAVSGYLKRGLPAFLAPSEPGQDGRRWRVLIGRFDTPEDAEKFGQGLVPQDGFTQLKVVRLDGAGP